MFKNLYRVCWAIVFMVACTTPAIAYNVEFEIDIVSCEDTGSVPEALIHRGIPRAVGATEVPLAVFLADGITRNEAELYFSDAVDVANTSIVNSKMAPTHFSVEKWVPTNYQSSGSTSADLNWLYANQGLHTNHLKVLLVRELLNGGSAAGGAGIATRTETALAVVSLQAGNTTLGHEFGHVFGGTHDPEASPSPGNHHGKKWSDLWTVTRTMLATTCVPGMGCVRIPHYANPSVLYEGEPTGTTGVSEAALVIEENIQLLFRNGNGCAPTSTNFCLSQGRFKVEVTWRDFAGNTGNGQTVPGNSSDSGLFWFFYSNNWEMLVKVLDACGLGNRYWVFFAATTNVEFTVTVTDTATGAVRKWTNLLGKSADAVTDTDAFPCS